MFDEDETFIDNALDIYRGKSISPIGREQKNSTLPTPNFDEEDADSDPETNTTSPIFKSINRTSLNRVANTSEMADSDTSTRSARDLLFGSQVSSDEESTPNIETLPGPSSRRSSSRTTSKQVSERRSSRQRPDTKKRLYDQLQDPSPRKEKKLKTDGSTTRRQNGLSPDKKNPIGIDFSLLRRARVMLLKIPYITRTLV